MIRKSLAVWLLTGMLFAFPRVEIASAAEQIGSSTKIVRSVTGRLAGRTAKLQRGDAVFRKQRVRAASASFGQFRLNDNSNLAVNANSSIVLDRFVFSGGSSAGKLVLKADGFDETTVNADVLGGEAGHAADNLAKLALVEMVRETVEVPRLDISLSMNTILSGGSTAIIY